MRCLVGEPFLGQCQSQDPRCVGLAGNGEGGVAGSLPWARRSSDCSWWKGHGDGPVFLGLLVTSLAPVRVGLVAGSRELPGVHAPFPWYQDVWQ